MTKRRGRGASRLRWCAVASLAVLVAGVAAGTSAAKPKLSDQSLQAPKIRPHLASKLASAGANELISISIWLNVADPPIARVASVLGAGATVPGAEQERLSDIAAYMAPKRQGVVKALQAMGVSATEPTYGPAVFARVTAAQVRKLARRSDVAAIYGPEQYGPHADDAGATERVNPVWALGNLGQLAGYVWPVVHEGEGVADFNPLLSNATHPVIYWCSAPASDCPAARTSRIIRRSSAVRSRRRSALPRHRALGTDNPECERRRVYQREFRRPGCQCIRVGDRKRR